MARFFIDRQVFAWVIAILICLLGGIALTGLPVAQYPSVAPPSISITANYTGASAEILSDTVTSVIEQQLNGIDNLLYMSSASDANGTAIITLYFIRTWPRCRSRTRCNSPRRACRRPSSSRAWWWPRRRGTS